jgi:hypothetical protein
VHAEATGHSQKVETRPYKVMKMLIIRGEKQRFIYMLLPRMNAQAQKMRRSLLGVRRSAAPCDPFDSTASISMVPAAAVVQETLKISTGDDQNDSDRGDFQNHGRMEPFQQGDFRNRIKGEKTRNRLSVMYV